jgi:hypothetical protein
MDSKLQALAYKSVFESMWGCLETDFRANGRGGRGGRGRGGADSINSQLRDNPRASDIAALFYRGKDNVDYITTTSFRRLCFMSDRVHVSMEEVTHVLAMCDESTPARRSNGDESPSSEEGATEDDDGESDGGRQRSGSVQAGMSSSDFGNGDIGLSLDSGCQLITPKAISNGGGKTSKSISMRLEPSSSITGRLAGRRNATAGRVADEAPPDGVMRRVQLRDAILLCEVLRVTYRTLRSSGGGPGDVGGVFTKATRRVVGKLGAGRRSMYDANYGSRAAKEAHAFDFGALFQRLGAVAARQDLADCFRQFSSEGDGRLDAAGLRALLLHVDPELARKPRGKPRKRAERREQGNVPASAGSAMLTLRFLLLHAEYELVDCDRMVTCESFRAGSTWWVGRDEAEAVTVFDFVLSQPKEASDRRKVGAAGDEDDGDGGGWDGGGDGRPSADISGGENNMDTLSWQQLIHALRLLNLRPTEQELKEVVVELARAGGGRRGNSAHSAPRGGHGWGKETDPSETSTSQRSFTSENSSSFSSENGSHSRLRPGLRHGGSGQLAAAGKKSRKSTKPALPSRTRAAEKLRRERTTPVADDGSSTPDIRAFRFHAVDVAAFLRIWRAVLASSESNEELLYNSFCFLDLDQSGGLEKNELNTMLMSIGDTLTREELGLFWNIVDVDNNGVLQYDEFMRALTFPEVVFERHIENSKSTGAFAHDRLSDSDGDVNDHGEHATHHRSYVDACDWMKAASSRHFASRDRDRSRHHLVDVNHHEAGRGGAVKENEAGTDTDNAGDDDVDGKDDGGVSLDGERQHSATWPIRDVGDDQDRNDGKDGNVSSWSSSGSSPAGSWADAAEFTAAYGQPFGSESKGNGGLSLDDERQLSAAQPIDGKSEGSRTLNGDSQTPEP